MTISCLAAVLAAGALSGAATVESPRVIGHRGTRGEYQENCAESMALALAKGVVGFETDIRLTKDGHLVIMHDERIERVSDGKGTVEEMTLEELKKFRLTDAKEPIPTLDEMLAPLKGRSDIYVELELKSSASTKAARFDEYIDKVYEAAKRLLEPGTYQFASFDEDYLKKMHERHPDAELGHISKDPLSAKQMARAKELGCTWVAAKLYGTKKDLVDRAHAQGLKVLMWMVQNMTEWKKARALGADVVTCDYPILLKQAILGQRKKAVALDLAATLGADPSKYSAENAKALAALKKKYRCVTVGPETPDRAAVLKWAKDNGLSPADVVYVGGRCDDGLERPAYARTLDRIVVTDAKKFAKAVSVLLK